MTSAAMRPAKGRRYLFNLLVLRPLGFLVSLEKPDNKKQIHAVAGLVLCILIQQVFQSTSAIAAENAQIINQTPVFGAARKKLGTVKPGQVFRVVGKSPDGKWVAIQGKSFKGWIRAQDAMLDAVSEATHPSLQDKSLFQEAEPTAGSSKASEEGAAPDIQSSESKLQDSEEKPRPSKRTRRAARRPSRGAVFGIEAEGALPRDIFGLGIGVGGVVGITIAGSSTISRIDVGVMGFVFPSAVSGEGKIYLGLGFVRVPFSLGPLFEIGPELGFAGYNLALSGGGSNGSASFSSITVGGNMGFRFSPGFSVPLGFRIYTSESGAAGREIYTGVRFNL